MEFNISLIIVCIISYIRFNIVKVSLFSHTTPQALIALKIIMFKIKSMYVCMYVCYPVDSMIHFLNNWSQATNSPWSLQ